MTQGKILNYAYVEAMRRWSTAKDRVDMEPHNQIRIERERSAWKDVEELNRLLNECSDN